MMGLFIYFNFIEFDSARHILCEKQGKINEAYKKLQDGWLSNGDKVPPAEFAKVNYSFHASFFFFCFRTLVSFVLTDIRAYIYD